MVVASDQHLGYANSNSQDFESFLDELSQRSDVDTFVILGDFVDMWRRDVSGVFLENNQILEKVLALKQKMKVYCVAGNHDFHLLNLLDHNYSLQFQKELTLPGNGVTYVLKHGWEFDFEQRESIMELLCYNMSDDAGRTRSDVWDGVRNLGGEVMNSLQDLIDLHQGQDQYIQHLLTPPHVRLASTYSDVENRALASVAAGQLLIFGHTHRPFLNASKNVANSGSWVSDENVTNTYVEIDGTQIHIMRQGVGDITQQLSRS
jgi:UDP-2,3-diacylglucosamine pyrophosphatase LpxH